MRPVGHWQILGEEHREWLPRRVEGSRGSIYQTQEHWGTGVMPQV
jgi:hypothetical protein